MIFIHNKHPTFSCFTTEYSDKIELKPLETQSINLYDYTHIIGNDLDKFLRNKQSSHFERIIDVMMFGLTQSTLDKLGMEAIVYAYNNYLSSHPLFRVDIPTDSFYLREIPNNIVKERVLLSFTDGSRFNIIVKRLGDATKNINFIGAEWPTCHYRAYKEPYLVLIYGRCDVKQVVDRKPIQN